jgi:hypothetical protein
MRDLVIKRLTGFIEDSNGYGIPRSFPPHGNDEWERIYDSQELDAMTEEELLEALETAVMLTYRD